MYSALMKGVSKPVTGSWWQQAFEQAVKNVPLLIEAFSNLSLCYQIEWRHPALSGSRQAVHFPLPIILDFLVTLDLGKISFVCTDPYSSPEANARWQSIILALSQLLASFCSSLRSLQTQILQGAARIWEPKTAYMVGFMQLPDRAYRLKSSDGSPHIFEYSSSCLVA